MIDEMTKIGISFDYDEEIEDALHREDWPKIRQSLIKAGYPLPAEDSDEILTDDEYLDLFTDTSSDAMEVGLFTIIECKLRRRVLNPLILFLNGIGHTILTKEEKREMTTFPAESSPEVTP